MDLLIAILIWPLQCIAIMVGMFLIFAVPALPFIIIKVLIDNRRNLHEVPKMR